MAASIPATAVPAATAPMAAPDASALMPLHVQEAVGLDPLVGEHRVVATISTNGIHDAVIVLDGTDDSDAERAPPADQREFVERTMQPPKKRARLEPLNAKPQPRRSSRNVGAPASGKLQNGSHGSESESDDVSGGEEAELESQVALAVGFQDEEFLEEEEAAFREAEQMYPNFQVNRPLYAKVTWPCGVCAAVASGRAQDCGTEPHITESCYPTLLHRLPYHS